MRYEIKRKATPADIVVCTARLEGVYQRRIMGSLDCVVSFDSPTYYEFKIGDYIEVFGERHYLNRAPVVKRGEGHFTYNLVFETIAYDLLKPAYLMLGDDNSFKEPILSLHATAEGFLRHIINNANRVQTGWQMGMVDSTEAVTMTFAGENCLNVLTQVAAQFNTEFWIDNQVIHLTKRGPITDLTFEYGKGKGLYEITRGPKDGTNVFTRLYAYGSQKNLLREYRNFSNNLLIPATSGTFLEKNTALYGTIEHVIYFDDIFPRRESTVTYTENLLSFTDSTMNFDLNEYLLPGEAAKVTFNSGQLAGFTFEITAYNHLTKTFEFKQNDEESIPFPNDSLKAAFGDKYVLVDIFMPQSYVDAAEQELLARATEYLNQNSVPRVMYQVQCDEIDFKRKGIYIGLGTFVRIVDSAMGVNSLLRVIGLTRDVSREFQYTLDLSETFTIPQILRQYAQQDKVNKFIDAQSKPSTTPAFVAKWAPLFMGPGYSTVDSAHATLNRAEYMKDPLGFVHLRGVVYRNSGAFDIAFTLPVGHKPNKYFYAEPARGLLNTNTRLTIRANGSAYYHTDAPGIDSFLLDGISFYAEASAVLEAVEEPVQDTTTPIPVLGIMYLSKTTGATSETVTWRIKSDIQIASVIYVNLQETYAGVTTNRVVELPVPLPQQGTTYYFGAYQYTYQRGYFSQTVRMTLLSGTGYTVGTENTASTTITALQ